MSNEPETDVLTETQSKWIDTVMNMTFGQIRVAKLLPPEIRADIKDKDVVLINRKTGDIRIIPPDLVLVVTGAQVEAAQHFSDELLAVGEARAAEKEAA